MGFEIGNKNTKNKIIIIAEISGNHNGKYEDAEKLVRAACESGAHVVKLQMYTPDTMTIDCDNKYFQVKFNDAWKGRNLYDLYKIAYTPWEWQPKLEKVAAEYNVPLFSTAFDITAVDYLEKNMNVPIHKISSFENGDLELLKKVAQSHKPVLLSRGMTSLEDLELPRAVKASYRTICSFLKYFYHQLGLEASFASDLDFKNQKTKERLGQYKNFCFSSWQHLDLLIEGKKIGGNAQRRRKDIIFQHGSIPQEIDFSRIRRTIKDSGELEARAISLEQALGKSLDFDLLSSLLCLSFKTAFGIEFRKDKLSESENEGVTSLLRGKYKTKDWINHKIFKNV